MFQFVVVRMLCFKCSKIINVSILGDDRGGWRGEPSSRSAQENNNYSCSGLILFLSFQTELKDRNELLLLCGDDRSPIYVNSAEDKFEDCVRRREDEGFSGTVYYREAKSMKAAENELLKEIRRKHPQSNLQDESDSPSRQGYVYLIKGSKCRRGQLEVSSGKKHYCSGLSLFLSPPAQTGSYSKTAPRFMP